MKRVVALQWGMLLFLASACLARPVADEILTATESDDGKTVRLAAGDSLVLRLEADPGAGYGWQLDIARGRTR